MNNGNGSISGRNSEWREVWEPSRDVASCSSIVPSVRPRGTQRQRPGSYPPNGWSPKTHSLHVFWDLDVSAELRMRLRDASDESHSASPPLQNKRMPYPVDIPAVVNALKLALSKGGAISGGKVMSQ